MRTTRLFMRKNPWSVALCAAAFLFLVVAGACNRRTEETRTAANDQNAQNAQTTQTTPAPSATEPSPATPPPTVPPHELSPEPRSIVVEEATPAPSPSQADLAARERALAQRQADLEAREKRLREREQQRRQARTTPRPAPEAAPALAAPAAPEPAEREAEVSDVDAHNAPAAPREEAEETRPEPVTVPAGTVMEVELLNTVSSATSRVGDTFRARISDDIEADGRVAIPAGSEIVGEVTEAVPLRKVGGQARLSVRFTDLVLPGGTTVPVDATFVRQGRNETGRDAATIGGSAAGGAILGRIFNKRDRGKGAVIGAIIGAVAGTVIASRTPGEEVTLESGSVVDLQLNGAVHVRPRR